MEYDLWIAFKIDKGMVSRTPVDAPRRIGRLSLVLEDYNLE